MFSSVPEQIAQLQASCAHLTALNQGDRTLSYGGLNYKADRFASYLLQLGIASGDSVAICLERSFEWIIAALGIMRAGCAYIPLDSGWPDSRLRFAVQDSGASALVASRELHDRLNVKATGIDPLLDAAAIAEAPAISLPEIQPNAVAYVIYTSGSSGVPKGVEITHAGLSNVVQWHRTTFEVTVKDRASQLLALGFDAAGLEIWGHVCGGATLCLADDASRSSAELMQQWIVRERLTICVVPAFFAAPLMTMTWPSDSALRLLVSGGEALQHGPIAGIPFQVVNHYGPTECSIVSTYAVLQPGENGAPPIGVPIAGATAYLLDKNQAPVPDGTVGEIFIGGRGVGVGYRNLPDLTQRSFLPDLFSDAEGARMYRTGDHGVRRSNGHIEFRGRVDQQIKIRGQRVELDEIACLLARHPNIEFATAVAKVSETRENQIVAYILPKKDASIPSANELRNQLALDLPESMIPAVFVRLHKPPLSLNGKIDFSLLPSPTESNLLERLAAKAPASQIERALLGMVRKVLNNELVTAQDNFFLAGGHSLLGMQLLIRVRDAFGLDLSLRELLEAPTAERLAVFVKTILVRNRLQDIWGEILGRKQTALDENFFHAGGRSELLPALQSRIFTEFGRHLSIAQLLQVPTVRQQSELIGKTVKARRVFPSGILALQPNGTRSPIFCVQHLNWVHYLQMNLADALGEDQPLLFVTLTPEDFAELGSAPTLQSIASLLLRTLIAAQGEGPYAIAGFDSGAVLAFEVAQQLCALGREVSRLVLVDPAKLTQLSSGEPAAVRWQYLQYAVTRGAGLGPRTSLSYLSRRLQKRFAPVLGTKSVQTDRTKAQELLNSALPAYKPEEYAGKVSLLLPSTRRPQTDVLAEWRSLVPHSLHVQCVQGHHRDLLKPSNVQSVASAITSGLASKAHGVDSPCCPSPASVSANYSESSQRQVGLGKNSSAVWWKRIPKFLPQ